MENKLNVELFDKQGYLHMKDVIPSSALSECRKKCINLKKKYINKLGEPRVWGTGKIWRGLEMASKLDEELIAFYLHPFMQQIAAPLFKSSQLYCFNDQVVVKLPGENFGFEEHNDNQYGPNPLAAAKGEFKTINFMWVLTNQTKESGPISCQNVETGEWEEIIAQAGDLIAIDGNTVHRSSQNTSEKVRAIYACVYSNKPIGNIDPIFNNDSILVNTLEKSLSIHPNVVSNSKFFFYDNKWTFCNCKAGINNTKLSDYDNDLWFQYLTDAQVEKILSNRKNMVDSSDLKAQKPFALDPVGGPS
tara:strand:- start:1 stop:912 length:912 start_codon:yes stop_codon:yes gene_type:complete